MSQITISQLGFDVNPKIKSVIFPEGILVEGDFVTLLIPLMGDPSLAPQVGAVISKINALKEASKDAEIEALKNKPPKPPKVSPDSKEHKQFYSSRLTDFQSLLSSVLIGEHLENYLTWVKSPKFSLDSKILSQDSLSYFECFYKDKFKTEMFKGISIVEGKYNGHCPKINRPMVNEWIMGLIDHYQWQMETSFSILYLLKLALDKMFEITEFSYTYLPQMPQDFKKEQNLVTESDWDWLHSAESDCLFETSRTTKWTVNKEKMETLFNEFVELYKLDDSECFDLKGRIAILSNLLSKSYWKPNNETIKTLLKAEGKQSVNMTNKKPLKFEKLPEEQTETKGKKQPTKKSRLTA